MKTLKCILKENLCESLTDTSTEREIRAWIRSNYHLSGMNISEENGKIIVNVRGDVELTSDSVRALTNGLFEFGKVTGSFLCANCNWLASLEGAPKYVGGDFNCMHCKQLKSLVGGPVYADGGFNCNGCDSLKNLEGAPEKCGGFNCSGCTKLRSLEGAPYEVVGNFWCTDCDELTSLTDGPRKITGVLYCYGCPKLKIPDSDRNKYNIMGDEIWNKELEDRR